MSIEEFLGKLEGVHEDGHGGWMACCPAHGDVNPSLHINLGQDGRILLKCFSGCTAEEICHAVGLELKDIMPDNGREPKRGRKAKAKPVKASPRPSSEAAKKEKDYGRHVCYYEYHNETGAIAYRVDRRIKKDGTKAFYQQHPDENSKYGWTWGVASQGIQVLPFRLPELLAAAKDGKTVVIAEGEKDVLNIVNRLHLAATCNSGGAGKWQASFASYLQGVPRVLIVADNDPEFKIVKGKKKPHWRGQRHAVDVEQKLLSGGFQGKIVKITMPDVVIGGCGEAIPCKDFTEWCDAMDLAGQTVDRSAFRNIVVNYGEWPSEWNFTVADLVDLTRSQKSERKSASPSAAMPGEAEDEGDDDEKSAALRSDGRGEIGEAGRYGRPCPRSPFKERGYVEVDFQMNAREIARFAVGKGGIEFQGWKRNDKTGEYKLDEEYDEIKCPASRMVAMALGCFHGFDEHFKIANPQRTELISSLMLAWLRARGQFFADVDNPQYETSMYFDSVDGILYYINSAEFKSFLATESCVSRESKVFDVMLALIEDFTMAKETPRVRPSKQWDRKGDNIYLSNGDSRMYKVGANKIEDVANGTDGVVFLRGLTLEPWKLKDGDGLDPFKHSMVFKYANFENQSDIMNMKLYTLGLFANHKNKPILFVNGPRGSGKTLILQAIKWLVGMRTDSKLDDSVNKIEHEDKGSADFWIIIDKGRFEIFDNFDYKVKWADNDLQVASTNGTKKTRELYKTAVLVVMHANAYIALSSNNAVFASEGGGLPDRMIKVGTRGRPLVSKDPDTLLDEIVKYRDDYMTWLARVLSRALADNQPVDQTINERHPAYADFAVRCGRAFGDEHAAIFALSRAEIEKAVVPIMNDPVAKEIVAVLADQTPLASLSFTAGDMAEMIVRRLGDDNIDEKSKAIYGSRRIGNVLNKRLVEDFHSIFNWASRTLEGRTRYDFNGLTPRGEVVWKSIAGALSGGSVDSDAGNPETLIGGARGASDSSALTPQTHPNPPHARAQLHPSPSLGVENKGVSLESEELDDFSF